MEDAVLQSRALLDWPTALNNIKDPSLQGTELSKLVRLEIEIETACRNYVNPSIKALEDRQADDFSQGLLSMFGGKYELDARLLYAKLLFIRGMYEDCLHTVLTDDWMTTSLRTRTKFTKWRQMRLTLLFAGCFAIKGICLEKTSNDLTRNQCSLVESSLAQSYRNASELGIEYFKEASQARIGYRANVELSDWLVECAMHRTPVVIFKRGATHDSLEWYRRFMNDLNTDSLKSIRNILLQQFVDILICSIREENYEPINPKDCSTQAFVPKGLHEECLLLLEYAEQACHEGVIINQNPERQEACAASRALLLYVLNLICLTYSRFGDYQRIVDAYKRAMKIAFQNASIWMSFALAAMANSLHRLAYLLLRECATMENCDKEVHLLLAQIAIDKLFMFEDAEKHLLAAEDSGCSKSKVTIYGAVLRIYQASDACDLTSRTHYLRSALSRAKRAKELNGGESQILYYLAYIYAQLGTSEQAMHTLSELSCVSPTDQFGLKLAVLILSSQKRYEEAYCLAETLAVGEPFDIEFCKLLCTLKARIHGYNQALIRFEQLLRSADGEFLSNQSLELDATISIAKDHTETSRELIPVHLKDAFKTFSLNLNSADNTNQVSFEVWIYVAETFINLNDFNAANDCLLEASKYCPGSPQLTYLRGRIAEKQGDNSRALTMYTDVIALQPGHCDALRAAAGLLMTEGKYILAEKLLRDSIRLECDSYKSWHMLGRLLMKNKSTRVEATQCLRVAVELEDKSPIMPYFKFIKPL